MLSKYLSSLSSMSKNAFCFGTMKLRVIIDNNKQSENLMSEHGFSSLLETTNGSMLFDSGQTETTLLHNIKELKLTGFEQKIQALALSHGHFDHTGGVHWLLQQRPKLPIYCHQSAFNGHYSQNILKKGGQLIANKDSKVVRDISFIKLDEIYKNLLNYNFIWTDAPTKIMKNVFVTGPIPRACKLETVGAGLFQDKLQTIPDPITDDQSLIVNTKLGYILVLGCCHAGLVNTINHVWNYFPKKRIYGIIGGTHLGQASKERLDMTIKFLKDINCQLVAASHCTGSVGSVLQKEFKEKYFLAGAGRVFEFEESDEELELKI